MYININEREFQDYNSILNLEIPFKDNYQESIRYYCDHYVRFNCMDYNDGMDFIARKFKNEEFEEFSNTETYKVLDKNVRCLHHGRQSSDDHRRKVREIARKIREEKKKQSTSLKIRVMINGIR